MKYPERAPPFSELREAQGEVSEGVRQELGARVLHCVTCHCYEQLPLPSENREARNRVSDQIRRESGAPAGRSASTRGVMGMRLSEADRSEIREAFEQYREAAKNPNPDETVGMATPAMLEGYKVYEFALPMLKRGSGSAKRT